jgi:hypothetical protein
MKIIKMKYVVDPIHGIVPSEVREIECNDAVANIRLTHNNVANGGDFMSEEDFNQIFKLKTTETDERIIEEDGSGTDRGAGEPTTKRTRKKRGTN